MKKNKINLRFRFETDSKKQSGSQLMKTFFKSNHLVASKKRLNNIMNYALKRDTSIKGEPAAIYLFHQSLQSFVFACYLTTLEKAKKQNHSQ